MQKDDRARLTHALGAARKAARFIKDRDREELDADEMFEAALIRTIEVVGEALNQVSAEFREMNPDFPWRSAIGMRNRLIHGYDGVDNEIVWRTATEELPKLAAKIERLLDKT